MCIIAALTAVKSSVKREPAQLDEVNKSLGESHQNAVRPKEGELILLNIALPCVHRRCKIWLNYKCSATADDGNVPLFYII